MLVGKKTVFAFLIAFGLTSICNAVGFGNLTVNSHSNQPLSAEIQLTGLKGIDPFSLQATLASPMDFDRAGIARSSELYNLIFEVSAESAKPAIIIRSLEPIHSSVLEFLVELVWSEGKLVKQFTIYLEPATNKKAITKQTKKLPATSIRTELLPDVVPDIDDAAIESQKTDITKHELYKTPIISKTKSVIKSEAGTANKKVSTKEKPSEKKPTNKDKKNDVKPSIDKPTIVTDKKENKIETQPSKTFEAQDALVDTPVDKSTLSKEIANAPNLNFEKIVSSEPQSVTENPKNITHKLIDTNKTTTKQTLVVNKVPNKTTGSKYWNLVMLILSTTIAIVLALFIRRKYASKPKLFNKVYSESELPLPTQTIPTKELLGTEKFTQVIGYSAVLQMKIDLARQYIEIGDSASAASLLSEVIAVADGAQKHEAQTIKQTI